MSQVWFVARRNVGQRNLVSKSYFLLPTGSDHIQFSFWAKLLGAPKASNGHFGSTSIFGPSQNCNHPWGVNK